MLTGLYRHPYNPCVVIGESLRTLCPIQGTNQVHFNKSIGARFARHFSGQSGDWRPRGLTLGFVVGVLSYDWVGIGFFRSTEFIPPLGGLFVETAEEAE